MIPWGTDMHPHPLGTLHLTLAVMAMATGALVAFSRKGTPLHRNLGWAYVIAMVGVNVTALFIYELFGGFGPFHMAAIFSLLTVFGGMWPMRLRPRPPGWMPKHAFWMAGSYVGLMAAATSEIATRYLDWDFGATVTGASSLVFVVGFGLMFHFIPRILGDLRWR